MRRFLFLAGALTFFSACASVPAPPPATQACPHVFLFWPGTNHTGILVPRKDFPVPSALADWPADASGDWVEVGFGSDEYFERLGHGLKMRPWRVLFSAPGVILVRRFVWQGSPEEWTGDALMRIDLPEPEYRRLLDYIAASFARDAAGAPILKVRLGSMSMYASSYPYSFRRICHTWVLDGLRRSGVPGPRGWPYLQKQVQDGYAESYRKPAVCR